jgi:nucleoside-diphosphate-sugar epimerase
MSSVPRVADAPAARSSGKRVLLTGAFGGIGRRVLARLLAAGHRVTCMDLRNPRTEKVAQTLPAGTAVAWGDIRAAESVEQALNGIDVVVHMAAIIPPLANENTQLATSVNVDGTRVLLEAMQRSPTAKRLVFASSMGVAGQRQEDRKPPLTADQPPTPDDHYGQTKVECETLVRHSGLNWTILRIAACPHDEILRGDIHSIRIMFDTSARGRVEFVHFEDVALAFANAVDRDASIGKVLYIGGGKRCQTEALEMYNSLFKAMGLGPLPASAFRPGPQMFFGDWLDTRESQAVLEFQRHSLDDFYGWVRRSVGSKRYLLKLASPIARRFILRQSPYYRKSG